MLIGFPPAFTCKTFRQGRLTGDPGASLTVAACGIDESGEDGYTSFAPFEISKRLRDFGSSCCARARLREMKALISSPVETSIWSSGRAHADEREAPIVPRMDELA
ncbi:hypothetical protein [Paraburkholderia caribensis]|uniref:hypothetical protein n=1 Tax=Paraburkholderia caribensis TaxID=75105 RepID=UPI001590E391|nr:hypothetical protein [Paraburkholderia caribensis]